MSFNKKFFTTGGIVASSAAPTPAALDPLQNFETVTYTGNGGTQKITGYIRKGAAFNGSSSYIDLGNNSSNNGSLISVSCWFNTTTTASESTIFNNGGNDSTSTGLSLVVTSAGVLRFNTNNSTSSYGQTFGTTVVNDGDWHHVVVTYNSGTLNVYLDGNTTPEITSTSHIFTTTASQNFVIGRFARTTLYYYEGKIDQVRIFDTALSSSEVTTLYNETYASSTKSTTDIFEDGSGVALYELDEDANSSNFGQSADFNGSNSEVNISSNLGLTGNTTHSTSFWVNFDATTNQHIYAIGGGQSPSFQHSSIYFDTSLTRVLHDNNGNADIFSNTLSLSTGVWYHVVFTYNSSNRNGEVFIDGSSVGSTTLSKDLDLQSSATTCFGKRIAYNSNRLNGQLDEFKVFNKVLTSQEIDDLYYNTDVASGNLIAHYKLDGNATDETGNYDGTASNLTYSAGVYGGTPTNVNFLGMAFQPDLVWIKARSGTYGSNPHRLEDSVRGSYYLSTSSTAQQQSVTSGIQSYNTNGFTVSYGNSYNGPGTNYVAWCWKAGGAAVSNTDGSITSTVSANQDAGFSIVKWSANGSVNDQLGHGLSSTPELIIYKALDTTSNWWTLTTAIDGSLDYLKLDTTDQAFDQPNTSISSTTISNYNFSSTDMIAYCFHSVDGYQRISTYDGVSGSSKRVYTTDDGTSTGNGGFRPRFVLIKNVDTSATRWMMYDSIRGTDKYLFAEESLSETTTTTLDLTFNDDGFTVPNVGSTWINDNSGATHLYLAIA